MKNILPAASAACILALTACANHGEKPESLLAEAELSLNQARSAEALTEAPSVYTSAERHLESAKQSIDNKKFKVATMDLEKSVADSKYAIVKSKSVKSEAAANQISEDLQALKQETLR